jgi:hypothetical protein
MSPFLPDGYRTPESKGGRYFKPTLGESRVRILDTPILGFEGWTPATQEKPNGRPVRRKLDDFPPGMLDPKKDVKHFWAMPVWNYSTLKVQLWEVTQNTIQQAIESLSYAKDWGDPRRYDLIIQRTGAGLETKYTIMPSPPKAASAEIKEAWKAAKDAGFDANRLYANGDPFSANGGAPSGQEPWDELNPPPDDDPLPF